MDVRWGLRAEEGAHDEAACLRVRPARRGGER